MDSEDPEWVSWMGECQQRKHTQHAPFTKMECDYLYGWIKKTVTYAKISSKIMNPRDNAGSAEEEKDDDYSYCYSSF